jgi:hypothetical protein
VILDGLRTYPKVPGITLVLERSSAATTALPVYVEPFFVPNSGPSSVPVGQLLVGDFYSSDSSCLHNLIFAGVCPVDNTTERNPQISVDPLLPSDSNSVPTKSVLFEDVRLPAALW